MRNNPVYTAILLSILCGVVINWSCKKEISTEQESNNVIQESRRNTLERGSFHSDDMVLLWDENVSKIISKIPGPPPVQARHFVMAQIAVHDALNSIVHRYKTYALKNYTNATANPDAAVASASYWTLKLLNDYLVSVPYSQLPLQTSGNDWEGWYVASMAGIPDGDAKSAGIEVGKKAAEAIMANRATDNFPTAGVSAVPIPSADLNPAIGLFRPTVSFPPYPQNIKGLANWPVLMKPFGIQSNDQFRPAPPPGLQTQLYAKDYNEVKNLGAKFNSTRTADQSQIANFWQETSVNTWNRFCRQIADDRNLGAWETARLLALLNVAIFDGFLSSFDGLYHYYTWRPESAIRLASEDGNKSTDPVTDWLPFVIDVKGPAPTFNPLTYSPPLPEYPNPQAVVGAAAGTIMQLFFLSDRANIDLISLDVMSTGVTRKFKKISDAVNENLNSRIYAGFNFRFSLNAGDLMGKKLGLYVTLMKFGPDLDGIFGQVVH